MYHWSGDKAHTPLGFLFPFSAPLSAAEREASKVILSLQSISSSIAFTLSVGRERWGKTGGRGEGRWEGEMREDGRKRWGKKGERGEVRREEEVREERRKGREKQKLWQSGGVYQLGQMVYQVMININWSQAASSQSQSSTKDSCRIAGNFRGWNFSWIGHFEHFQILIFEDSPVKWSHTHKQAMCFAYAHAHVKRLRWR